jgi:hypothetical protein
MKRITQSTAVENKAEFSSMIAAFFRSFNLSSLLKKTGAYKAKGVPAVTVFRRLFELVFLHKSLFEILRTEGNAAAAKDTFYRFVNSCRINWMCFTTLLAARIVRGRIAPLTDEKRVNVFIVDDTVYERDRSKTVELLSRVYDHSKKIFVRGFRLLTLGWSDGNTFIPVNFSLLASADAKNRFQEAHLMDRRTCGYRQRQLAVGTAPAAMMEMIRSAVASGLSASYVLFDSWFSTPPNILAVKEAKLDVIAMVKKTSKVLYRFKDQMLSVTKIFSQKPKRRGRSRYLLSVEAEICSRDGEQSIPVQLVFVRNRNKRKEYLVLVSTDLSLSEEEIIRLYGKRWNIEVFFKACKSLLRLTKECQSISYDAMITWVAIVFTRYTMLSYLNRMEVDDRTTGELFYETCDELADITLLEAFHLLLKVFAEYVSEKLQLAEEELKVMLDAFIKMLPAPLKKRLIPEP